MTEAREIVARICAMRHLPYPQRADRILAALEQCEPITYGDHMRGKWAEAVTERDALQRQASVYERIIHGLASDKAVEAARDVYDDHFEDTDNSREQCFKAAITAAIEAAGAKHVP